MSGGLLGDDSALPLDPNEEVHFRHLGDQTTTDRAVRLRHLYGEMLVHRETDLYVAEESRGRSLQDVIRGRLRAEHFDPDDADEWAFRDWRRRLGDREVRNSNRQDPQICARVVEAAVAYRDTGIPNDEAFAWVIRSIEADRAVCLRSQGWNPVAFSTLLSLCFLRSPAIDDAMAWVEAPIVWWRALRYLRAGSSLNEALLLEDQRLQGDDIDAAINTLIALTDTHHTNEWEKR